MIALALALAVAAPGPAAADSTLAALVLADDERALTLAEERLRAAKPGEDRGLLFLRAELLSRRGNHREAAEAFALALTGIESLRPAARLALARTQLELGHPEVSTALAAGLLTAKAPPELEAGAVAVLRTALARGGDCRFLASVARTSLASPARARVLDVARADCHARAGELDQALARLTTLLLEKVEDEAGLEAALRMRAQPLPLGDHAQRALARALHHHRLFEEAAVVLTAIVARLPATLDGSDAEMLYLLGRSEFWRERYHEAAAAFAELARRTSSTSAHARALYQLGRTEELAGNRAAAIAAYARCVTVEPAGAWSGAALASGLRLEWLEGRRDRAASILGQLATRRTWRESWLRSKLFLLASAVETRDLASAQGLLAGLAPADPEVAYWRGRVAELAGEPQRAVLAYREAFAPDPRGPFGHEALARLAQPALVAAAVELQLRLGRSIDLRDLAAAVILAQARGNDAGAAELRARALATMAPTVRAGFDLAPPNPAAWPLWARPHQDAEDTLLALGLWRHVRTRRVQERFPSGEPALALAAAAHLDALGLHRAALLLVEPVAKRLANTVPVALWPERLDQQLHPRPWLAIVRSHSARRGIEPALLYAIAREESRFDPNALSEASARGLTQFVLPTAQRLAPTIGRSRLAAEDLYDPEVALALGAAYLAELRESVDAPDEASTHLVVAAYNAGEPQTRLWRSYCVSNSRAEFLSKVGFEQTRGYLDRVLRSREGYRRDPLLRGALRAAGDPPAGARPAGR